MAPAGVKIPMPKKCLTCGRPFDEPVRDAEDAFMEWAVKEGYSEAEAQAALDGDSDALCSLADQWYAFEYAWNTRGG